MLSDIRRRHFSSTAHLGLNIGILQDVSKRKADSAFFVKRQMQERRQLYCRYEDTMKFRHTIVRPVLSLKVFQECGINFLGISILHLNGNSMQYPGLMSLCHGSALEEIGGMSKGHGNSIKVKTSIAAGLHSGIAIPIIVPHCLTHKLSGLQISYWTTYCNRTNCSHLDLGGTSFVTHSFVFPIALWFLLLELFRWRLWLLRNYWLFGCKA